MPGDRVLTVEHLGHVAQVWLDRASVHNAMGTAFFAQLPQVFDELGADPAVRAVVLGARGRHFTVGLDLKEMGAMLTGASPATTAPAAAAGTLGPTTAATLGTDATATTAALGTDAAATTAAISTDAAGTASDRSGVQLEQDQAKRPPRPSAAARAHATRRSVLHMQRAITAVADCPKPVVAAVHGYCIGGGVDLITACDIRLASADARLSVRETKMAIVADLGTLQRLPRLVPRGHVAELAYTGKDIDAERARQIGLVNDVFPDRDTLHQAALALATEIAANPPLAVQGTKAVLTASVDRPVADGLDYVATLNAGMLHSDDLVEAVAAFMEKRPPKFTGN